MSVQVAFDLCLFNGSNSGFCVSPLLSGSDLLSLNFVNIVTASEAFLIEDIVASGIGYAADVSFIDDQSANLTCLDMDFATQVGSLPNVYLDENCADGSSAASLLIVAESTDHFTLRSANGRQCLTAVSPSGEVITSAAAISTDAKAQVEFCYDVSNCRIESPSVSCAAREVAQSFFIEGLAEILPPTKQPTPQPTFPPFTSAPSARPFTPFGNRFKRIYTSAILLVFVGVIVGLCYRYDLVPELMKDFFKCRCCRRANNATILLEGLDLDTKKPAKGGIVLKTGDVTPTPQLSL